jgi:hypothetical protein
MQMLLLMSILIMSVALPMVAARDRSAVRGFRRLVVWMAAFNVLYLIGLLYIYPRLF